MGMRAVPSDVGSANGFAVAEQRREAQRRRMVSGGDFSAYERAIEDLRRTPEFCMDCGEASHIAINALVALRRRHEQVTPRMLRAAIWHYITNMVNLGRWSSDHRDWVLAELLPHLVRLDHSGDREAA